MLKLKQMANHLAFLVTFHARCGHLDYFGGRNFIFFHLVKKSEPIYQHPSR